MFGRIERPRVGEVLASYVEHFGDRLYCVVLSTQALHYHRLCFLQLGQNGWGQNAFQSPVSELLALNPQLDALTG